MATVSTDYYHALYDVAKTVSSTLRLPQVLGLIVESTARAMRAKACSLRLLTPSRDELEIGAEYGLSKEYVEKGPVIVARSPIDAEALAGRVVQVRDVRYDPRLQYPEAMSREGIASLLVVPVVVRDTAIGVMRVYSAQARDFAPAEVEFLEAIASLGGIAIENARIYEALEAQFEAIRREKIPWAENFGKPRWR